MGVVNANRPILHCIDIEMALHSGTESVSLCIYGPARQRNCLDEGIFGLTAHLLPRCACTEGLTREFKVSCSPRVIAGLGSQLMNIERGYPFDQLRLK